MRIFGKKGISSIIATALILVLTVVAVSIVANYVIPFTTKSLESTECVKYKDYFIFDNSFEYNCFDPAAQDHYALTVKQNPSEKSEDIIGFKLVLEKEGFTELFEVNSSIDQSCGSSTVKGIKILDQAKICPASGKLKIPGEDGFKIITYLLNTAGGTDYKKAKIYPILKDGRTCAESDNILINQCSISLS